MIKMGDVTLVDGLKKNTPQKAWDSPCNIKYPQNRSISIPQWILHLVPRKTCGIRLRNQGPGSSGSSGSSCAHGSGGAQSVSKDRSQAWNGAWGPWGIWGPMGDQWGPGPVWQPGPGAFGWNVPIGSSGKSTRPFVNCKRWQKTNWKDPPFSSVNPRTFDWAMFNSFVMYVYQAGYYLYYVVYFYQSPEPMPIAIPSHGPPWSICLWISIL